MLFTNIFIFNILITYINCARILAIIPTPAYSHQQLLRPLWRSLLAKGHHLTLLTTDPLNDKHENLKQIDLQFTYNLVDKTQIVEKSKKNFINVAEDILQIRTFVYDEEMKHEEVKKLIKSNETFDLLIVEYMLPAFFAFQHKFKCPLIGITTTDVHILGHSFMGNPNHPLAYPSNLITIDKSQLSFKERVLSVLFHLFLKYFIYNRVFVVQDEMVKKHFGSDMPPLLELSQEVDMLFINSDPLLYNLRPTVPAVQFFGAGKHLEPEEFLTEVTE